MSTIHRSDMSFGGVVYTRIVNFSIKLRKFSVAIPKECAEVLGYERIEDESLDGLEKKYRDASEAFLNTKAKMRKIIVYRILMNCGSDVRVGRSRFELLGYHDDGIGLQVVAGVYVEKKYNFTKAGHEKLNTTYDQVKSSIPDFMSEEVHHWNCKKYKILDWTPEREEFFRTFGEAMSKLCQRVSDFLGDEKKLLELIANGSRILPPPDSQGGG